MTWWERVLRDEVTRLLGPWMRLLTLVVQNNPRADIYDLLARPDVARLLEGALDIAQREATAAVERAWSTDTSSAYRQALLADVTRAYAGAAAQLRTVAVSAAATVPPEPFQPGVHRPGTNPDAAAAMARARAVQAAVAAAVRWLGYRNDLTVSVARTRHATEAEIAEGLKLEGWLKKWRSRRDRKVCPWCRVLDMAPAIPLDQEFTTEAIRGHAPPRVYLDLLGPPLHPHCRCKLVLVRASEVAASRETSQPDGWRLLSASDVRAMDPVRYQVVRTFYGEAVRHLALSARGEHAQQDLELHH